MAKRKYRSEALRSVHVTVEGLHRIGLVDKKTMRRFDVSCLTTVEEMGPKDIVAIREREGVSQGVFARYLNVAPTLVSQWERGERQPTGTAVKLLSLVKRKGLEAIA
jgi:putative transcriptional regulator